MVEYIQKNVENFLVENIKNKLLNKKFEIKNKIFEKNEIFRRKLKQDLTFLRKNYKKLNEEMDF